MHESVQDRAAGDNALGYSVGDAPRRQRHVAIPEANAAALAGPADPGLAGHGLDPDLPAGLPGIPVPARGAGLVGRCAGTMGPANSVGADAAVGCGVPAVVFSRLSQNWTAPARLHAGHRGARLRAA